MGKLLVPPATKTGLDYEAGACLIKLTECLYTNPALDVELVNSEEAYVLYYGNV